MAITATVVDLLVYTTEILYLLIFSEFKFYGIQVSIVYLQCLSG